MKKKILITGGAGFLGSHLAKNLLQQGNSIIILDNLMTGNVRNIEKFFENKNFQFIKHDVINPIDIKVDIIFNLACPASPPWYQRDPIHTIKTNFLGSLNMLELAKKYEAKIFQASTSEVYGDPLMHPQIESYKGNVNCTGIRSCYDEGKRCAESLFFDYKRMFNVNIKIVRIFNTYGPSMDPKDGRVVSNFIIQALKGESLTVYGNGSQTRSFCYIDDLIDGFLKMIDSDLDFTGPVNLGNPVEFNLLELADLILKITNSNSKIIFKNLPKDDPIRRKPDIKLAKEKLNWEPKVCLNDGLIKTIKYFESILNCESRNSCRGQVSCFASCSST
ncbi:NAD-dependent epimerase/dehydratase family protein [Candidatus Dependentiae bacterium]|nr:NAD-dependent epimerase/dehydratase family protein [Candidatus Dependentiae bacterium]